MDYYKVLGVSKGSSPDEIKKAYREKALEYHPDRNSDDAEAEARFKEINEAHGVLSDPQKRQSYDRFGLRDRSVGSVPPPDMEDFLRNFGFRVDFTQGGRRTPQKGANLLTELVVSLSEAVLGVKKKLRVSFTSPCFDCQGSGATEFDVCGDCNGAGVQAADRGTMRTISMCRSCGGVGRFPLNVCSECSGSCSVSVDKSLDVTVPAGIHHGQRMALRALGPAGLNGGPPGDVVLSIRIKYPKNLTAAQKDFLKGLDE